ncbi:MAG TPA: hypothetical protein ENH97_00615 [bacterium]|nr:hypothetical protein [bacterium]
MRLFGIILGYIGLHLLWGRKASFPYAVGFNLKWYFIFFSGYLIDLAVLLLLYWGYERTFSLKPLAWAKEKILTFEERISRSRMISWARPMGKASLFLMPAIPTAGRPFNILFLTRIFKLKYKESFFLFALGNLIGTIIWVSVLEGIITWAKILALLHH